jgi:hypothetical protein
LDGRGLVGDAFGVALSPLEDEEGGQQADQDQDAQEGPRAGLAGCVGHRSSLAFGMGILEVVEGDRG